MPRRSIATYGRQVHRVRLYLKLDDWRILDRDAELFGCDVGRFLEVLIEERCRVARGEPSVVDTRVDPSLLEALRVPGAFFGRPSVDDNP